MVDQLSGNQPKNLKIEDIKNCDRGKTIFLVLKMLLRFYCCVQLLKKPPIYIGNPMINLKTQP